MSNVLYWMFLHSPLTVVERHPHREEAFPPAPDVQVTGVDATISEGWLDLKVRNDTKEGYQIALDFDGTSLYGSLRCEKPAEYRYQVYNSSVEHFCKKDQLYCRADVMRRTIRLADGREETTRLYQNLCRIGYEMEEEGS